MIFGTRLALDNSNHVLDGGPNPPTEGEIAPVKLSGRKTLRSASFVFSCLRVLSVYDNTGSVVLFTNIFRSATSALAEFLYSL